MSHSAPELKKYMDKKLRIQMNAGRRVSGILRGFDPFMNLVLDEAVEHVKTENLFEKQEPIGTVVVRGSSIVLLENIDRIY